MPLQLTDLKQVEGRKRSDIRPHHLIADELLNFFPKFFMKFSRKQPVHGTGFTYIKYQ